MNCKTVTFALALCVVSFAAVAQSTTPQKPGEAPSTATSEAREKYRAACGGDIQKFCANVERAKGAMRSCLDANASQLSDTCKGARAERAAARAIDTPK